jgi:N-sulfoglucosamine sulfohydrolase
VGPWRQSRVKQHRTNPGSAAILAACFTRYILLSLLLLNTCAFAAARKPNLLLIVSEDNGPELGCYGDPYAQTPTLDRLASEGVLFENAFVPYSVCSPSRACFLTGLYPQQNGHLGLATHAFTLYKKFATLPGELKAAGYRTGIIGKLHVNPANAFPFDFKAIPSANFGKRDMKAYAAAASKFINAGDEPFFLSINYPDAHFPLLRQQFGLPVTPIEADEVKPLPWVGADSPRLRQFTADYYNCLRRLDDGVALLLDELAKAGKAENTLILYIGDHGAQFSRGKTSVYEAGLRIPMIAHWPGKVKAGERRKELVSSIDIMPSFISAAGAVVPEGLPGRPLQPLMRGEAVPWRDVFCAIATGAAPAIRCMQMSIRDARYKLIYSPMREKNYSAQAYLTQYNPHFAAGTQEGEISAAMQGVYDRYLNPPVFEFYDLEKDPYEFHDLANDPAFAVERERLFKRFRAWQESIKDPFREEANVRFFADMQAEQAQGAYRKKKHFRWPYLDVFSRQKPTGRLP